MTLTANMRAVLEALRKQPARRVHTDQPGKPLWPHNASTLAALVRHELARREEQINARRFRVDVWSITEAGREALKPREVHRNAPVWYPVRVDKAGANLPDNDDEFSPQARGYTTNPAWASDTTPADPDQVSTPVSLAKHVQARRDDHIHTEAKKLGRQVQELAVFAARQGLANELDALRRTVAQLHQRRREAA